MASENSKFGEISRSNLGEISRENLNEISHRNSDEISRSNLESSAKFLAPNSREANYALIAHEYERAGKFILAGLYYKRAGESGGVARCEQSFARMKSYYLGLWRDGGVENIHKLETWMAKL